MIWREVFGGDFEIIKKVHVSSQSFKPLFLMLATCILLSIAMRKDTIFSESLIKKLQSRSKICIIHMIISERIY